MPAGELIVLPALSSIGTCSEMGMKWLPATTSLKWCRGFRVHWRKLGGERLDARRSALVRRGLWVIHDLQNFDLGAEVRIAVLSHTPAPGSEPRNERGREHCAGWVGFTHGARPAEARGTGRGGWR